jgi:hypothetical protein
MIRIVRSLRAAMVALLVMVGVASPMAGAATLADTLGADWKGLPDWRGVWYLEGPMLFAGPQHAVIAKTPSSGKPFERGITPGSYLSGAPYKPEFQNLYDERVARARGENLVQDPVDSCSTPHGMPRLMGAGPTAVEFLVTPKQTWIVWDFLNETRRIHTDGRGHPGEDQKWPRTMGHSIGRWEGQTLVIDTVWMMAGIYDRSGAPHSDQIHLSERIARTDARTLTVEMTIEDPVMFTAPWHVTRHFRKSSKKWENVPGTYCVYEDRQPVRAD